MKTLVEMKTLIGITEENRNAVAEQLAKLLADEFVLYTKTLNAHWNVEGRDFHSVHVFLEEQYGQLQGFVDSVAERMRKIGHYAPATLQTFLSLTHLTEYSERQNDSQGYLRDLAEDHSIIIESIRGNIKPFAEQYKDLGTSDFITTLMEEHERMAWMLRAHLVNP